MFARVAIIVAFAVSITAHSASCPNANVDADIDRVNLLQSPLQTDHVIKSHGSNDTSTGSQLKLSAAFAEFVAMTLFVILGCGSAMAVAKEPGWVLQVALTFGFAITALAYAVGHHSGGQINCAVTFGLVLTGQVSILQGLVNFAAQILGSLFGAFILTMMIPEEQDKTGGIGSNKVADGMSQMNAFVGEFVMTFLLMFVVLETAVNPEAKANREMAALAIGFAVFLAHSVLINIDGCSINPTRSFGPWAVRRLVYKKEADSSSDMWVFWAGPLLGSLGACIVSTLLMR